MKVGADLEVPGRRQITGAGTEHDYPGFSRFYALDKAPAVTTDWSVMVIRVPLAERAPSANFLSREAGTSEPSYRSVASRFRIQITPKEAIRDICLPEKRIAQGSPIWQLQYYCSY